MCFEPLRNCGVDGYLVQRFRVAQPIMASQIVVVESVVEKYVEHLSRRAPVRPPGREGRFQVVGFTIKAFAEQTLPLDPKLAEIEMSTESRGGFHRAVQPLEPTFGQSGVPRV